MNPKFVQNTLRLLCDLEFFLVEFLGVTIVKSTTGTKYEKTTKILIIH